MGSFRPAVRLGYVSYTPNTRILVFPKRLGYVIVQKARVLVRNNPNLGPNPRVLQLPGCVRYGAWDSKLRSGLYPSRIAPILTMFGQN